MLACWVQPRLDASREDLSMKRSRFTEEQITFALRQAEAGTPVAEVCRKLQITETTLTCPRY